jgi:hypothetical protein
MATELAGRNQPLSFISHWNYFWIWFIISWADSLHFPLNITFAPLLCFLCAAMEGDPPYFVAILFCFHAGGWGDFKHNGFTDPTTVQSWVKLFLPWPVALPSSRSCCVLHSPLHSLKVV